MAAPRFSSPARPKCRTAQSSRHHGPRGMFRAKCPPVLPWPIRPAEHTHPEGDIASVRRPIGEVADITKTASPIRSRAQRSGARRHAAGHLPATPSARIRSHTHDRAGLLTYPEGKLPELPLPRKEISGERAGATEMGEMTRPPPCGLTSGSSPAGCRPPRRGARRTSTRRPRVRPPRRGRTDAVMPPLSARRAAGRARRGRHRGRRRGPSRRRGSPPSRRRRASG